MRRSKGFKSSGRTRFYGFTLVEILVVISIIALLLAVMIPVLAKAKEIGNRIVCENHLKTLCMANCVYANQNNHFYVPVRATYGSWLQNKSFRKIIDVDSYKDKNTKDGMALDLPDAFLCPSDKISITAGGNRLSGVLLSYGYNYTDWETSDWTGSVTSSTTNLGHKADRLIQSSAKLAFTDSVDWWVVWRSADYSGAEPPHNKLICWDTLHQANIKTYKGDPPGTNRMDGPTIFRHNEGANVGFYDGHAEYLKKQAFFVIGDRLANPRRPGMWVGDLPTYLKNGANRGR
jgi:prepilin-type processing-associated H-X9-DG protein/prepilin-type N-terminal cleavage/methylation domain-containing protein